MLKFTTVCNLSSLRENWGTVGFMKIPEPKKVKYILVVRQIRERGCGQWLYHKTHVFVCFFLYQNQIITPIWEYNII